MRTLVTGGAGFIGSHLVDALLERGDDVLVVDDFSSGRPSNLPRTERLQVERDRLFKIAGHVQQFKPHTIFHLAAQVSVTRSEDNPAVDAAINVAGTVAALDAAKKHGVKRFVFVSTGGAIYGDGGPFTETDTPRPDSIYGQSKLAAEGYVDLYRRKGLSTCTLRLANVYGPRQSSTGEAGVIAIFKSLENHHPAIFGDGSQTRDFIHVSDVVDALTKAAASCAAGPLNIGTGKATSVLELTRLLNTPPPIFKASRPGEVQHSTLDASKAKTELDWTPKLDLAHGLNTF